MDRPAPQVRASGAALFHHCPQTDSAAPEVRVDTNLGHSNDPSARLPTEQATSCLGGLWDLHRLQSQNVTDLTFKRYEGTQGP